MLTKLIGLGLVVDGIGSWLQYRKQKVLVTKNRIISLHWAHKLEYEKLPKGKVKFIEQSTFEHIPRWFRAMVGLTAGIGLIVLPLPV